jgi:plastocyanin
MTRTLSLLLLLSAAAGSTGCGKSDKASPADTGGATPGAAGQAPAATSTVDLSNAGKITGKVSFTGTAPLAKTAAVAGDPFCTTANPDGYVIEDVIVNPNQTLKNVVVFVKKGLEGKKFPPASGPVHVDQQNCRYVPHVQVVQTGQSLRVTNSDDTLHNVHSVSTLNDVFNKAQPKKGDENVFTELKKTEIVKLKCDVHSFMMAHLHVLPHPCAAVTGDDGTFTIEGVPPGEYEVVAWHEKYGSTPVQKVKVEPKGSAAADFTVKG